MLREIRFCCISHFRRIPPNTSIAVNTGLVMILPVVRRLSLQIQQGDSALQGGWIVLDKEGCHVSSISQLSQCIIVLEIQSHVLPAL